MTDAEGFASVCERVEAAARASGREGDSVTLVVVTKSVAATRVRAVIAAGARDLGENRAQELLEKARILEGAPVRWHFIGRLQRNKVKALAPLVGTWQSVDRRELAAEIAQHAPGGTVFVQVNLAGERQKGGCTPEDAPALVSACRDMGLGVEGLMTVPPAATDPTPWFRQLRRLADDLGLRGCSMGMSEDFEAAIACGATLVRVGSAVFGPRPQG
ncbi:MAG TPA: YggS family pyridoxal phosphate-dependent enzyme [Acidimicrobiia bacterium]|nr:YggS family pyridoxal phosphate-dependent enzyme [Acidimicrobiia bacterium]